MSRDVALCGAWVLKIKNVDEQSFMDSLHELALLSYEDQCTPANPRLAIVEDMEEILRKAYYGEVK